METQHSIKIKYICTDNGLEFKMAEFLATKRVVHQCSCPYVPQQNGVVKRKRKYILNMVQSMMFKANLPKKFWADCVTHAVYLIN